MRFPEINPGSTGYENPRHHIVYKPGDSGEVADLFPHGEAGYNSARARVQELGGDARIQYVFGSAQYFDRLANNPIPWHGESASHGDGVKHTPEDWRMEVTDSDRIEIAKLNELSAKYPNMDFVVGFGGEDISIHQQLSSDSGISHSRGIAVVSGRPFLHSTPILPGELANDKNLAVLVGQTRVGPTVSSRVKDPGRVILGLLDVEAAGKEPLEVRQVENTLNLDLVEVLDAVVGGLRLFKQRTRIHDREYRPKITATCIDPTFIGSFPRRLNSVLEVLEGKNIRLT